MTVEESVIYFIEDRDTGLIKIGYTITIRERLAQLRSVENNPRLRLLATTPGGRHLENLIHVALDGTRHHREWFHPSDALTSLLNLACVLTPQQAVEQAMVATAQPTAEPVNPTDDIVAFLDGAAYWGAWAGLL